MLSVANKLIQQLPFLLLLLLLPPLTLIKKNSSPAEIAPCETCGAVLIGMASFCPHCGEPLIIPKTNKGT
jgi:hypothetical protein